MNPLVSIVIPVLRDTEAAVRLVSSIPAGLPVEVIVADGGDDRVLAQMQSQTPLRVVRSAPGRAVQMNAGSAVATGDWLLFLHADSRLPAGWFEALRGVPSSASGGWFRFALDAGAWQARVIERGVAWRVRLLRLPYGDQGIFIRRTLFETLGRYQELPLLEDVALVRRLVAAGPVVELPLPITTSARRWQRDGWLRRSVLNVAIISAYFAGVPPSRLARWYARPSPR